ncbi:MAG: carbon-nitrogen family hydrolase [Clostridiales bacterium]|nr:carbon-nitrogen family hydrolase [Clostridiales bacterium]
MKIALGQLQIHWEDKNANLEKVEKYLRLLKVEEAEMFLLPEMSLTGFSMNTDRTKESERETVSRIRALAAQYGIAIGVGWVKDTGKLCENHYSIVAPSEEILDYAKLHPFSYGGERQYFQGGEKLPVCEYRGLGIGVQICYDLRFPEPFCRLSEKAGMILVPANWCAARREHWMCLLQARAIENQVYIAGINCAGEMGNLYYSGDSAVFGPDGTRLVHETISLPGSCPEEKVLLYRVNNDVNRYREAFPVKRDRREELYRTLS